MPRLFADPWPCGSQHRNDPAIIRVARPELDRDISASTSFLN